jgi:hypothetical protein
MAAVEVGQGFSRPAHKSLMGNRCPVRVVIPPDPAASGDSLTSQWAPQQLPFRREGRPMAWGCGMRRRIIIVLL